MFINDGYQVGYKCPVTDRMFGTMIHTCDTPTLDALARAQKAHTEEVTEKIQRVHGERSIDEMRKLYALGT